MEVYSKTDLKPTVNSITYWLLLLLLLYEPPSD